MFRQPMPTKEQLPTRTPSVWLLIFVDIR